MGEGPAKREPYVGGGPVGLKFIITLLNVSTFSLEFKNTGLTFSPDNLLSVGASPSKIVS